MALLQSDLFRALGMDEMLINTVEELVDSATAKGPTDGEWSDEIPLWNGVSMWLHFLPDRTCDFQYTAHSSDKDRREYFYKQRGGLQIVK